MKKTRRNLAKIIELINTGKASKLELQANNVKRKKLEEQRLQDMKVSILGAEKAKEYDTARKFEKSNKQRKRSRKEKLKKLENKERQRRQQKATEADLLNHYYQQELGSNSDSDSSASSLEIKPKKHKKKKHKKKVKKYVSESDSA